MDSSLRAHYQMEYSLGSQEAPGGVLVYYADGDEEIIHVNQYVIDLFECDGVDDFLELTGGSFRGFVEGGDVLAAEDSIWGQVGASDGYDHIYYRVRTKTGRLVSIDDYGRLVQNAEGGRPVFYVFVVELKQGSSVDWLTGLPDMHRFHELARLGAAAIVERGGRPVAVAFDLMGMKNYNTLHGRDEGDRLLRAFGDQLRAQFGTEACSRFGEDHFYAFGEEREVEAKVRAALAGFEACELANTLPVRVGCYACDPQDDIAALGFDRAKIACDLDRSTWLSHVTWFTDEMRYAARLRIHVLENLDRALGEGWVRPHYQPVVRSATGVVCGEEALARWEDPAYGQLSPAQFVPVLEDAGLMFKLDLHMVDCVLADMERKRAAGIGLVPVSINFSRGDLLKFNIAQELAARASAAGLDHALLTVEITESLASSDPELLQSQIAALHAEGFEVWMDDFGSGLSSLNTIENFDFDLLKLDMGFLRGNHVEKAHIIIAQVIQMASRMGMEVLAEGVETRDQAEFLSSVGCGILQGYFYGKPQRLEELLRMQHAGELMAREPIAEGPYWRAVSVLNLDDLSVTGVARGFDGEPMSEFPAGIVECRGGSWTLLRANRAYQRFLVSVGMLDLNADRLAAASLDGRIDPEFMAAAQRCSESGSWERVASKVELGSGFQFYVVPIALAHGASSFMVVGVPTMLGSALGIYGDVPVAYAVFRVQLNEAQTEVVDAEYVYANDLYCEWGGVPQAELLGKSFLQAARDASTLWFPYCYRAVVERETIHDVVYSPETGHWLNFYVAPSPVEGHCVYAFALADEQQEEREEMMVGRDTSDLIIEIADALSGETVYSVAMSNLVRTVGSSVAAERVYLIERKPGKNEVFEWCAPGVESKRAQLEAADASHFETWERLYGHQDVVYMPSMEPVRGVNPSLYEHLRMQGVHSMLSVPIYQDGHLVGTLGMDNFRPIVGLDTLRLFKTVASFVSARMVSHRVMQELEHIGLYDGLTGILNRRGIDTAIRARLNANPQAPYALVLMDVDDFKTVNDLYGHDVGDEALRTLSHVVQGYFPADSILGRNGGDELLVMLFGEACARVDELMAELATRKLAYAHDEKCYTLSISAGYVSYPDQVSSLREAYTSADAALYAVKLSGKGSCLRFSDGMDLQQRMRLGITPRDVSDNMPGAVLVHEPGGEGQILYANDELLRLFGCASFEDFLALTGGVYAGVIHPDDHERVRNELASQMSLDDVGRKDSVRFRVVTRSGQELRVLNVGRLVETSDGIKLFYELLVPSTDGA